MYQPEFAQNLRVRNHLEFALVHQQNVQPAKQAREEHNDTTMVNKYNASLFVLFISIFRLYGGGEQVGASAHNIASVRFCPPLILSTDEYEEKTAISVTKDVDVRLPRFRGQRVELFIKLPEAHGLPLPVRVAVGGRELCEQLDWDEGCATKS